MPIVKTNASTKRADRSLASIVWQMLIATWVSYAPFLLVHVWILDAPMTMTVKD